MKKKKSVIAIAGLIFVLLTGAFVVAFLAFFNSANATAEPEKKDLTMFSAYTDAELYQNIPAMTGKDIKIGEAEDYGDDNWVLDVNGTSVEEYQTYVATLQEEGFQKHSDNGEDAMEGYVMTTCLTKDDLTITLSHVIKQDKTYVAVGKNLPLSDHLIYKPEYVEGLNADAKTKVHMLELNNFGNNFVIQLKNGHFVVHDGGNAEDAPYLLDYLESLTPEGEKPVIEAWFLSHAHGDHTAAYTVIANDEADRKRIYVDGVYFTEPNAEFLANLDYSETGLMMNTTLSHAMLTTSTGEMTKLYRPQLGQRYYFCDITVDVCLTQEQIPPEDLYTKSFSTDFNDTSIWLMHNIEGQKFFVGGDGNFCGINKVMAMYDQAYFDIEVFATLHHAVNVYNYFTDFISVDTLLYTSYRVGSIAQDGSWREAKEANAYLQASVKESISWGDGTVILAFPYSVGEAEIAEHFDWRYNGGVPTGGDYSTRN